MKKYYGFIYKGRNTTYNIETEAFFDTPFDALKNTNESWNTNPDFQIARLLVVISSENSEVNTPLLQYAFFQFTTSESCKKFIVNQEEIIWSTNEKQVWNGDAQMM